MSRYVCLLVLILSAVLLGPPVPVLAAEDRQPNIILIFCDDLGYGDLGIHWQNQRRDAGKPAIATPQIDAMARQGVLMPHTYCPAPVCAPSRASLLLGVTQGHANVRDNQFDKALEDNHTLASVLGQAGYATAAFGKWGLQGRGPTDDMPNKFEAHPMNRGFDYYFGYIRHRDGHRHYPKEDGKECYDGAVDVSEQLDLCYTTDLFTARAKKWIVDQVQADADKPFFVYLAHDTPHAILQNPPCAYPQGGGLNGGVQWLGRPGQMINTAKGTYDRWVHPDYAKTDWPEQYKRYANSVQRIDDTVGDLLQLLGDLKIDDNTLVIFTSDNGPSKESYLKDMAYNPEFFQGFGPFDGIKRDLWEGGIRPGAIARWPGTIPAGRISDEPGIFSDFMATFCDAANTPTPARSDGVSLLPSMTGVGEQRPSNVYIEYENKGRTPMYGQFEPHHAGRRRGQMQAIRLGDLIGVRYNIQSHADDFEIYNIVEDPKQTSNIVDDLDYAASNQFFKSEVLRRRVVNDSAPRPYDNEPMPALHSAPATKPLLYAQAFERSVDYVQQVDGLKPTAWIFKSNFNVVAEQLPRTHLISGFLTVPETGEYTFDLTTPMQSLMRLHDATIIDNDRSFVAGMSVTGKVRLQQGVHPIRVYINTEGDKQGPIVLKWSGPGIDGLQPIPEEALRQRAENER